MNWKTILLLSLFAIPIGLNNVFGFIQELKWLLWLIIAIISAYVLYKQTNRLLFTHAVLTGVIIGIFNSVVQSALFDKYFENNPEIAGLPQWSITIEPQYFLLMVGPFRGIIYGLLIGLFALIMKKILKSR